MTDEIKGREHLVRRHQVLTAVFKRFSVVWRTAFAASRWADLLDTWNDQLRGIDTDHLDGAAKEFLRTSATAYPPKPWEFAKFARSFSRSQQVTAPMIEDKGAPGILAGARRFWFVRQTPDGPMYAFGMALVSGGSVGIADVEMDKLLAGEMQWGWGEPGIQAAS